jgi:outer membrane protein OmpA-like peptidoglycan-associated protein
MPGDGSADEAERLRLLLLWREQQRLDRLEARILDAAAARGTVREVVVDALKDAQVADARRLAGVIAPAVVSSIHAEIRNSRDMMVDALYPITGRMVSAAVRDAFQRLMIELDRRIAGTLPFERVAARIEALVTRKPVAEVLLRRNPSFVATDVLLIHRSTGLLIHREADGAQALDGDVLSGLLTAILGFAADAFGADGAGDVKTLTFGASSVHLAASPALLLALRGEGAAPEAIAATLDAALADLIEAHGASLGDFSGTLEEAVTERVQLDLRALLGTVQALGRPKRKQTGAIIMLGVLIAALVAVVGYSWWERSRIDALEARAHAAIAEVADARGWPVVVRHRSSDDRVVVTGLVADRATLTALQDTLQRRLGGQADAAGLIDAGYDRLVGAIGAAEATAARAIAASRDEQLARLAREGADLRAMLAAQDRAAADRLAAVVDRLEGLERNVAGAIGMVEQAAGSGLDALGSRFGGALSDLGGALAQLRRELEADIARVADRSEGRASELATALVDYGRELQTLDARVRPLEDIATDPQRLLADAVAVAAVFFSDEDVLADPQQTTDVIEHLATLLQEVPAARLRIVGFSDPTGRAGLNASLSQARADRVRGLLLAAGVAADRLLTVGRATERRLAPGTGPSLRDRRVEFELVRAGEP